MNDEAKEKGLDALEAALASADPAEAPDIAEELAAEMSDTLDETAKPNDAAKERPS